MSTTLLYYDRCVLTPSSISVCDQQMSKASGAAAAASAAMDKDDGGDAGDDGEDDGIIEIDSDKDEMEGLGLGADKRAALSGEHKSLVPWIEK